MCRGALRSYGIHRVLWSVIKLARKRFQRTRRIAISIPCPARLGLGPGINDPRYMTNWSKWSMTFSGILRNRLRCIIGWNLALDEMGKPNIGPFSCGGLVTVHSETREIVRSGQYWAFAHYSRALQRGARVIDSDGDIKNVHHIAALNPDGSYVVVLTNTGALPSTVWLRKENRAIELPLQSDSIATLVWK